MPYKDPEKHKAACRARYAANRKEHLAYAVEYQKTHPAYKRSRRQQEDHNLFSVYGIRTQDRDDMESAQEGFCLVCNREMGADRNVDHDHSGTFKKGEPGFVRGLLCRKCNLMLGYADDIPARLRAGAKYLEITMAMSSYGSSDSDSSTCDADCEVLKKHQEIIGDPDRHKKAMDKLQQDQVLHQKAVQTNQKLHGKVKQGLKKAFPTGGDKSPFQKAEGGD